MSNGSKKQTAHRIRALRKRDGDNCMHCGRRLDFTLPPGKGHGPSVDHIKPRAAGGTSDLANLQLLHAKPCQNVKGSNWEGTDYQKLNSTTGSPYGIGKHYRHRWQSRYAWDIQADGSDWDTPVLPCP
jgi:5-methylcytosine-specific restriction endonuclease McrA